jgi:hypothetical protein
MHKMHILSIRNATFHKAKPPRMTRNPVTRPGKKQEQWEIIFTTQRHIMAVSFTSTFTPQERVDNA